MVVCNCRRQFASDLGLGADGANGCELHPRSHRRDLARLSLSAERRFPGPPDRCRSPRRSHAHQGSDGSPHRPPPPAPGVGSDAPLAAGQLPARNRRDDRDPASLGGSRGGHAGQRIRARDSRQADSRPGHQYVGAQGAAVVLPLAKSPYALSLVLRLCRCGLRPGPRAARAVPPPRRSTLVLSRLGDRRRLALFPPEQQTRCLHDGRHSSGRCPRRLVHCNCSGGGGEALWS